MKHCRWMHGGVPFVTGAVGWDPLTLFPCFLHTLSGSFSRPGILVLVALEMGTGRGRDTVEREEHPRAISQIPTPPLHLGSHIAGGPFRMQHFLWRNPNLTQSLRRFGSAFNILPNFSAFSTMQFVVVTVSFSKRWSFFSSYKKKPFSFVHLARDTWKEIEGFSNNFAFLRFSKPRPGWGSTCFTFNWVFSSPFFVFCFFCNWILQWLMGGTPDQQGPGPRSLLPGFLQLKLLSAGAAPSQLPLEGNILQPRCIFSSFLCRDCCIGKWWTRRKPETTEPTDPAPWVKATCTIITCAIICISRLYWETGKADWRYFKVTKT